MKISVSQEPGEFIIRTWYLVNPFQFGMSLIFFGLAFCAFSGIALVLWTNGAIQRSVFLVVMIGIGALLSFAGVLTVVVFLSQKRLSEVHEIMHFDDRTSELRVLGERIGVRMVRSIGATSIKVKHDANGRHSRYRLHQIYLETQDGVEYVLFSAYSGMMMRLPRVAQRAAEALRVEFVDAPASGVVDEGAIREYIRH